MKKLLVILLLMSSIVQAGENVWTDIYARIIDAYVYDVSAGELAVAVVKGLSNVDGDLRGGNDLSRITLYYKGKVVKVLRKPTNDNDIEKWGSLTEEIVATAVEVSKTAAERDFEITDVLASEMIKVLDKDSKFYADYDAASGVGVRNKRMFAARMERGILYIKIAAFNKQTLKELEKTLVKYKNESALILDLRGCPGGMPGEAVMAADLFLDGGIAASSRGKDILSETFYNADEESVWMNKSIFILVDGETASAAEIFTAALQEQGKAKVIGTTTKGKGTMQKLIVLPTGSVIAVTNGFFMTPSGNDINNQGVNPDICTFEMPERKDVDNLFKQQDGKCFPENRENTELELKVVERILQN